MKKKIFGSLLVAVLTVFMTGCVKFNASMDIKKDKSMDFNIIYAVDTTYFGNEEILTEEDKQELVNKGYTVSDYVDGTMKGFNISTSIDNIDLVSAEEDTNYSLSGLLSGETDKYLFKVKKGFLKNTYTAKLEFDSDDSSLSSSDEEESDEYDYDDSYSDDTSLDDSYSDDYYTAGDEDTSDVTDDSLFGTEDTETEEDDSLSDFDFNSMTSMDLSFNVNLPYAAISNNATTVSEDGKTLTWSLTTDEASSMEFEFELYNMTNIYLIVIIAIIIIAVVVVLIMKNKKGNKPVSPVVYGQPASSDVATNISSDVYQQSLQSVENNSLNSVVTGVTAGVVVENTMQQPVVTEVPVQPVAEPVVTVAPVQPVAEPVVTEVPVQPVVESVVTEVPVQPVVESVVTEVPVQPVAEPVVTEAPVQPVVEPVAPESAQDTTEVMDI